MQADYWHQKWADNKIGFHQERANKRLEHHWPELGLAGDETVFVPLCGKSLDMLWLHRQGLSVLGVELSEKAVQSFFSDNALTCEQHESDGFLVFTGTAEAQGIQILVGDYFSLTPDHLHHCKALYDRASLIAMNQDMRSSYAAHLGRLLAPGTRGLLLAISYDEGRMEGPPFSVPQENVHELLGEHFDIGELAHYSGPERLGNLADRGLETLDERVYVLTRNP